MTDFHDDFCERYGEKSKRKFTQEEDDIIRQMVKEHGAHSWKIVSEALVNRTPRQCRERYKHYLSQVISKSPWSEDEDRILEEQYSLLGPKWSTIAKMLPGRTDVNIKNRWSLLLRKYQRDHKKKEKSRKVTNDIINIEDLKYSDIFQNQEQTAYQMILNELDLLQAQASGDMSSEIYSIINL